MTKTQAYEPRVSVVLNTCDRGAYLGDTLEGLKQQTYKNFEVIVVNGPSIDDTEEVAKRYNVRYYTAPFNISVSRNVGIKHAAGDILAFIDDDAVPEPEWLSDIVEAYHDKPEIGAAGGFVYNADGSDFQFCYGMIDRWGYPQTRTDTPYEYNKPNGQFYNINIGTNASYRRTALIEAGGFDEEIEYYHDESDVCVRLINKGYKVAQLSNAFVHHKMAPSMRRDNAKLVKNWDAIVKNTLYYGLKTTAGNAPLYKRIFTFVPKEGKKFIGMFLLLLRGHYTPWQYIFRNFSLVRAVFRGYYRGFFQTRKLISGYDYKPGEFKQYITEEKKNPLNIVLVSQGFPPTNTDGISRYNHTLAKQLANMGHRVFVVTKSQEKGRHTIFYRDKYWIYYHDTSEFTSEVTGFGRTDDLIALNKSIYDTVLGIKSKVKVDAILAPLWDVEGLALVRKKLAPTAVTLMSPLKKVVETQWYWLDDPSLEVVFDLEKFCIENADGIMPISNAIKDTIGEAYEIDWAKLSKNIPIEIVPLGVESTISSKRPVNEGDNSDEVSILFVGRFERRKGIDILLEASRKLLAENKNIRLDLVGNPDITDENNKKYFKEFEKLYGKESWFKQIFVHGYVSDEELAEMYANCDVFVAPSRYESFGLIFIEAMSHGKPVIGTNVGGIPEIIYDGENGHLFENENPQDLYVKLKKLAGSADLREKMGKKSVEILNTKFSSDLMGERVEKFIRSVIRNSK